MEHIRRVELLVVLGSPEVHEHVAVCTVATVLVLALVV